MENKQTTIRVSQETKNILDGLKVHPRQTHDEVLKNIMDEVIKLQEEKQEREK